MARYPRIRELREKAGLSQEALAEYLGIHRMAYVRYECGICDPPLFFLYDLAVFYNLSSDYIIGLTNTPRPLNTKKKPGS